MRDVVRERRIDPRADELSVRGVATQAVAEHEALSLTGAVPSLDEPDAVVGQLVAKVVGLGLLQQFLDDDDVEDLWINEPTRVVRGASGASRTHHAHADDRAGA